MRVSTTSELIDLLRRSMLLNDSQLAQLESYGSMDPQKLARRLVRSGWITRWQGLTLLEGRCQFFIGKYRLLDLIGTGGMGAVFKAIRPEIGRVVAIKVLKPKVLKKLSGLPRFLREIRSAASLDHPNIVQAFDAEEANGTYILVMEYVDGKDLKGYITAKEPMSIPWICECMRQAAIGLQHAADRGTVHRDIKPANIIVSQPDANMIPVVKILDFGLARFVSEAEEDGGLTRVGQAVGTPDYIAPEQAQNSRSADIRADIYGLGSTFFELLTGQVPYPIENLTEKLIARVRFDAPRVRELRPDIPPEIDAIVTKMMQRNPAQRYQTAAELARALAPYSLAAGRTTGVAGAASASSSSDWDIPADSVYGRFLDVLRDGTASTGSLSSGIAVTVAGIVARNRRTAIAGGLATIALMLLGIIFAFSGGATRSQAETGQADPEGDKKGDSNAHVVAQAPEIETLLQIGATLTVLVQERTPGSLEWPAAESGGPRRWVIEVDRTTSRVIGLSDVVGVEVRDDPSIQHEELRILAQLPSLEQIHLGGCAIDDLGVVHLASLSAVRLLNLSRTQISDECLKSIAGLLLLEELNIDQTNTTGATLGELKGLKHLRRLSLDGINLNRKGFEQLELLANLEALSLRGINPGEYEISGITKLSRLKQVNLESTDIPEKTITELSRKVPQLEIRR